MNHGKNVIHNAQDLSGKGLKRRAGFRPVSSVTASRRRNMKKQARMPAPHSPSPFLIPFRMSEAITNLL